MSDTYSIPEAIARTLRTDTDLATRTHTELPDHTGDDLPLALVLESTGTSRLSGMGPSYRRTFRVQVWVLVKSRGELREAMVPSRPWVNRLLDLFEANPTLETADGDWFGNLYEGDTTIEWRDGVFAWGQHEYTGVELFIGGVAYPPAPNVNPCEE